MRQSLYYNPIRKDCGIRQGDANARAIKRRGIGKLAHLIRARGNGEMSARTHGAIRADVGHCALRRQLANGGAWHYFRQLFQASRKRTMAV